MFTEVTVHEVFPPLVVQPAAHLNEIDWPGSDAALWKPPSLVNVIVIFPALAVVLFVAVTLLTPAGSCFSTSLKKLSSASLVRSLSLSPASIRSSWPSCPCMAADIDRFPLHFG